jgi:hypothetical protein
VKDTFLEEFPHAWREVVGPMPAGTAGCRCWWQSALAAAAERGDSRRAGRVLTGTPALTAGAVLNVVAQGAVPQLVQRRAGVAALEQPGRPGLPDDDVDLSYRCR